MPALIIIIDEYAELASTTPPARSRHADSIARLGRAVAVTLIAATQRPTQKAMGQGAVRSQMDVRICFRVRERKDTDLVLGQGMLTAGWNPHTLNAPGKFLISAPEHDTPRRARGYLLTDQAVTDTAARFAACPASPDEISRTRSKPTPGPPLALVTPRTNHDARPAETVTPDPEMPSCGARCTPRPATGISVPHLMIQTGMSRRWIYYRLRELEAAGLVTQTTRGHWRFTAQSDDSE